MSEKVARLAVQQLRKNMFPQLPQDIQDLFPKTTDPLGPRPADGSIPDLDQVPNIMVGQYQDFGANAGTLLVTVYSSGSAEGIVKVYRHLELYVDIWVSSAESSNVEARRIASIIYEYIFRNLHNKNWSGENIQIERCYEIERSPILFDGQNKICHIANVYRVEALSAVWY